jgi:hypothetical protein
MGPSTRTGFGLSAILLGHVNSTEALPNSDNIFVGGSGDCEVTPIIGGLNYDRPVQLVTWETCP